MEIRHPFQIPADEEIIGVITKKKVVPNKENIPVNSLKESARTTNQLLETVFETSYGVRYRDISGIWDPKDKRIQDNALALFNGDILDDDQERFVAYQKTCNFFIESGNINEAYAKILTHRLFSSLDQAVLLAPNQD